VLPARTINSSSSPSRRKNPLPIPILRPRRGAEIVFGCLLLGIILLGPGPVAPATARAQSVSEAAPDSLEAADVRVGEVSVVGNTSTDRERIIRSFGVRPQSRYLADLVRRGIRQLFGLGLFDDVWVEQHERPGLVDLVIHVVERPRITKVEFSGNKRREDSDLEKKQTLRAGQVYAPSAVQAQIDSLVMYYKDEGFAQVQIQAEKDTTGGQIALRFVIREGERVRVTRIEFVGASAFPQKKLRKNIKTKKRGFFGGGHVKEGEFPENRSKLERFYRSRGYREARLVDQRLLPTSDPRNLTLQIEVAEGPMYYFGAATFNDNEVLSDSELGRMWSPDPGDRYDVTKIESTTGLAYSEYAERGFLYVNIDASESTRDSIVDVSFSFTEGKPSHVRYVEISGNRGTREKVIRREIDIHEGDRFRRSTLVRTQGDIFRLGLFEDVQIDFSPADSTDVDIRLKLKEKQVGTASAGAGYTSESGLTGFLELGHNNVLGNGQSLALHLERGGRREDYSVSFTEPWFRDTPTLLGFSLFNSSRDRDLFEERRRGGAGRIGRPLPWPDYSRGSISYRLEEVRIDSLGTLSEADRIALGGLALGRNLLTSSVTTNFSRNSTDNPFYPTRGTRLQLEDEFAGGPFGGQTHFHKHRIEGRWYTTTPVIKAFTTMFRGRVGLLGEYADQEVSKVPDYERFRLGGGTTVDPLRGYDDYQVVPDKFIREITVTRVTMDSLGNAVTDTLGKNTVRYPGGRFMAVWTMEQQFPIVHPLHGVFFFDAGNTWDLFDEIRPLDLKAGAGFGFRLEIPLLGNIGFDYGYGFNRDDGARWAGHFLIGNVSF
jgi:outer membrane protein insertion porin family